MTLKKILESKIDIFLIFILISCLIIGSQYYYNMNENSCIGNPLVYGAKEMTKLYGYEFIGAGSFLVGNAISPIITFNSTDIVITNYKNNVSLNFSEFIK